MITQKHGRKLASQLGEVLLVCQFYDLQIETKVSLSLRNFVVALSVCVCPSSPQRHYTEFKMNISKRLSDQFSVYMAETVSVKLAKEALKKEISVQ